ncbi:nitroreductase [Streptomyces sulfonofaciens]|uniref:Nitroreductase n=1 Tax=Streptomyces sulfonofaciens TaxID=68272 RepID=A0A919GEU2_9ACTN|nr:nitroreductase family deazaflavin-dependent oxidoreductase [Streptomyces sulfonofaciens]GHH82878.1 nitroreductase [Streptomyces sulfonofaciens]
MPLNGAYEPSALDVAREQVALYESSNGSEGRTIAGRPVVVLTMRGKRTGKIRKTPVMRVENAGRYALVASQGGSPRHPAWYHNVMGDPRVELQDGPERREYLAHEAAGREREEWWKRAVEAFPDYAEYQRGTERVIPVLVLEPVAT